MADKELDQGKRRFLLAATGAVGGVAGAAAAVPFVASMLPSERAKAAGAPVEADIGNLAPGEMTSRIDAWCAEHDVAPPRTRAEYTRSIVESLAQAFADAVADAARLGRVDVRTIHIVGGGALNELLCQRTADRAGMPVLAGPVEATAIGNCLVQAIAAREIASIDQARRVVRESFEMKEYEPQRGVDWDAAAGRFLGLTASC